jgi:hypothetical protein
MASFDQSNSISVLWKSFAQTFFATFFFFLLLSPTKVKRKDVMEL